MNKTVPTLPPNTTALERAIAVACAELVNVPVPLRDLWNADRCPVNLLPFLAWACSVDRWDDAWPESIKRGTIKASYFIHKHKGTIAAVRRVVESLGYLIRITEWWQTMPPGTPGTSFIIALPNGCQVKKWHLRLRFDSARKAAAELALKAGDEELASRVRAFQFRDIRARSASDIADLGAASSLLGHSEKVITEKVYRRIGQAVRPTR